MSIYTEVVRTRLSPELAEAIRQYARNNMMHDATVIRIAVKTFFDTKGIEIKQSGVNQKPGRKPKQTTKG